MAEMFLHSSIQDFGGHSAGAYYVPGTLLYPEDTTVNVVGLVRLAL